MMVQGWNRFCPVCSRALTKEEESWQLQLVSSERSGDSSAPVKGDDIQANLGKCSSLQIRKILQKDDTPCKMQCLKLVLLSL